MAREGESNPVQFHAAEYIYVQIADHLAARIASGEIRVGARLPSMNALAEQYGVAALTARRAIHMLRDRGLVIMVPGRGTVVVADRPQEPRAD